MTITTWKGATGNWRDRADWSDGVPNASDEADVTAGGSYSITLSRADGFSVGAVDFDAAGATLALKGSLTLGGVFDLKAGTLAMSQNGVIHGGTLMMDGGSLLSQGGIGSRPGTLDGVHLGGTLELSAGVEDLRVTGGLTGTGANARIELSGGEDALIFAGDQRIDNVTILVDNPNSYSVVEAKGTLTLGPNATLTTGAFGPFAVLAGGRVINDGSIIAGASGALGTFNIGLNRAFINNGLLEAQSNMDLTSRGVVVNKAGGAIEVGSFITLFIQGGFARGGFTNRGVMTIANGGSIQIASNTSIVNAGTISVGAGNLALEQSTGPGVVTFTNTGAITVGSQGSLSLLLNFTVASLGDIVDAGRLIIDGTLDNTGQTLRLGSGPLFGGAGTTLASSGLILGGTVVLGGARLNYQGGGLQNVTFEGAIDLSAAGASLGLDGGVVVTGANGQGPGLIKLTGAGATLSFVDQPGAGVNAIDNVTIDAGGKHGGVTLQLAAFHGPSLTLDLGAHVDIVSSVAGAQVSVQAQFPTAGTLVSAGMIEATASGGAFTVSLAMFENDGQVSIANGDVFTLEGALSGNGRLTLATGGEAVLGAAASGQTVAFADGTGLLELSAAARFAATISGMVAGDKIDLLNTAATAARVNAQDQLVISRHGAAVATLQLSGDYSHARFHVGSDGAGGSMITLTNTAAGRALAGVMAGMAAAMAPTFGGVMNAHGQRAPTLAPILAPPA